MIRKIVSLTLFIAFLLLIFSSIVLYIAPEGRVAYWGNWEVLWLSKTQWGDLHITGGTVFVLFSLWHVLLNWKLIIAYIANKTKAFGAMPVAIVLALLLNWCVYAGTLMGVQPLQQLLTWNQEVKDYQAKMLGNPPYAHAEMSSIGQFCSFLGWDAGKVLMQLQAEQLQGEISLQSTIGDLAKANNMTPQQLYLIMQKSLSDNPFLALPPSPPEGLGKKSLIAIATEYNLPLESILGKLHAAGIEATQDQTVREIAGKYSMLPPEVYVIIREE